MVLLPAPGIHLYDMPLGSCDCVIDEAGSFSMFCSFLVSAVSEQVVAGPESCARREA